MTRLLIVLTWAVIGFGGGKWGAAKTKRDLDPMNIPGATRILQPPVAPQAWQELDRCAPVTVRVPLDSVRWVQADSIPLKYGHIYSLPRGLVIDGAWIPEHHTVLLRTNALRRSAEYRHFVVRHELMHVRLSPWMGHPDKYFNTECGTAELYPRK